MNKLRVLGSGSKGNCYSLEVNNKILIIDAGFVYKEILEFLDYDISNVVGCLVTHEHKDHSKGIEGLIKNGIDVYTSEDVIESLGDIKSKHRLHTVKPYSKFKIDEFYIYAFELTHDCYNLGFLIMHKEIGKLIYATDTYCINDNFKGVNHYLIECNYQEGWLDNCIIKHRIIHSHMDLEDLKIYLSRIDRTKLQNIMLIHLSSNNCNKEECRTEIEKILGMPVRIARKGAEIIF